MSNLFVLNWVRSFGQEVQALSNKDSKVDYVELDEMYSFIGNNETIAGFGLLLIDMGKSSSISLLATEVQRLQKISGN